MAGATSRVIRDPYCAIGLYWIEPGPTAGEAFFDLSVAWFESKGILPDVAALGGPGFSGKTVRFASARSRLRKLGFQQLEWFSLVSMIPGGDDVLRDAVLSVDWTVTRRQVCIEASAGVTSLEDSLLRDLANDCVAALKPQYGIGLTMEQRRGPGFYVGGIVYSASWQDFVRFGKAEDEADRISDWGYIALPFEVYREGLLRDVYRWNFLTEPHVHREIHGRSLLDWVREKSGRGVIEKATAGIWLWQVDEKDLSAVRIVIRDAGLVFDRGSYGGKAGQSPTFS